MLGKAHLSFVLLLVILQQVFAQPSLENPQIINKTSGLPSDNVNAILKDDRGFMWFATDDGLCRWDGIAVKVFQYNPSDSTSISGNSIPRSAFILDTMSGQIMLGTENGLSFFDPYKSTFKNFISKDSSTAFLSKIHGVFVDRQETIWLGTSTGIVRFGRNGHTFRVYRFSGNYPSQTIIDKKNTNDIFDITQDIKNDSILWLATLRGLLKFNKYSGRFEFFSFENKKFRDELNIFNKIVSHSNGKLYLGTWNTDMVVFNTVNEKFEFSYGPYSSNPRYFLASLLVPYFEKSKHELWVSSLEGIGIFNTGNNRLKIIKTFRNAEGKNYAPGIAFLDTKTIWLSSEYGAIRIQLDGKYFTNYFIPPIDENHWFLPTSFFEDTVRKRLYTGFARGQGLDYFDLKTRKFRFIPIPKRIIKENIVRAVLPLDKESVFLLTPDEVYKFSLTGQQAVPLHVKYKYYPDFSGIVSDSRKRVWVCSKISGLQQLDKATGNLREINKVKTYYDKKGMLPKFGGIVVDNQDRIWFRDEGSYGFYDPENDSMHYFKGKQAMTLLSFLKGKKDTIWVGTAKNGLGFINSGQPEKGIRIYNPNFKKRIISFQRDTAGNFFMLTSSGIEKLVPGHSRTVVFNENEGLVKYDKWANRDATLPGKLFKMADGRMVIGYRRGIGFFYPDSLHKTEEKFTPYISSLKVSGKELPLEEGTPSSKTLKFNHDQNSLTFEYSALAIADGKNIRFFHRLKGVDNDWVSSVNRNVNYSNLRPGSYSFIIRAENESSPGTVREAAFNFIIRPPWWNTWWALTFYVLAFAAIFYSAYRYQLSRILARRETARLRDLDRVKSRLYANITHEFRTPLTVIKGMADEMIDNMTPQEQKRFDDKLEMIERNSDKLLHLVQQMLDMSKIEDGKMKLNLIQDNVVSYLQYVLESFQSMADAKNIKLVFYHETDPIVMDYDQDKIFVIASNLLSNAIKFTPSGGKVIFHVKKETLDEKDQLVIKVQDSGIGIKDDHLQHIFDRFYQVDNPLTRKGEGTGIGLALTKELVELMKGEITVKSMPGIRTEFCVTIPVNNKAPLQKAKILTAQTAAKYSDTIEIVNKPENGDLPLALIVEDNQDVAKYIISCLAGKYRVKWAPDGEQGLKTAVSTIPDIIISDVMMPGKDGFEVCGILKQDELTSHIPIILLTAKATEADRIEGLSHGADAYLTKPFNKKELFVRLEQLIRIRRQLQEKYSKVGISLTQKAKPTGEERFLKKAVEIIEKNLDDPELNASLLAKNLNMSESQLYRKLKALGRKSTALFIRGIRLSAAKDMLETTDFNVSEIAYLCGFNNPAWFSRTFKEEFGVAPSAFRK